jgi:nicotinamidase-related amidase
MTKTGLDALLRPEDSILVLIDHQSYQFTNLNSHEPATIINNVIGLAKTAKVFNVPTILTTVIEERGGHLIKGLQDVFPDQKPIDRTFINTWGGPERRRHREEERTQATRAGRALHRDLPGDAGDPCAR